MAKLLSARGLLIGAGAVIVTGAAVGTLVAISAPAAGGSTSAESAAAAAIGDATAAFLAPPVDPLAAVVVELDERDPAPEFAGIEAWLNGDPETMAGLQGQVVLIDFWTFGCINCRRTLPYLGQWYDRYTPYGLKVIGVHTPEFGYESELDNVRGALADLGVDWAVAIDNDKKTWRAWRNRWWPRKFLIDADGIVRYDRIGEGAYLQTEKAIRLLLEENGADLSDVPFGGRRE